MRANASFRLVAIAGWVLVAVLALGLTACSKEPTAPAARRTPQAPNNSPEVMSLAANPSQVPVGRNADVIADARDPDDDPLTYE